MNIYLSVTVGEIILFPMINQHKVSNNINSQFYMEQLLKPVNSLRTTGHQWASMTCNNADSSFEIFNFLIMWCANYFQVSIIFPYRTESLSYSNLHAS